MTLDPHHAGIAIRSAAIFGSTLALFVRSLREDSRSLLAHLLRFGLLAVVLFFLYVTHRESLRFGSPGRDLFSALAYLNAFFIALAGISFFATAITEEKEERSLGLLLMADIRPVSLLIGKSLPRVLAALLLILIQFPFTLLAITLGGVTTVQVMAAYATLLAQMLFLANLALVCSVVCRRSAAASRLMVILLVGLYFIPILLAGAPTWGGGFWRGVAETVNETSAFHRLAKILETGFAGPVVGVQVISNLIAAGVCFALAWLLFDRYRHDEGTDDSGGNFRRWLASFEGGREFGARRCWTNALAWKDFYYLTGGKRLLLAKFALYGLLHVGMGVYFSTVMGGWWDAEDVSGLVMSVSLMALMLEIAVQAGRIFRNEVREQTLSTLMMLPLSVAQIAWSKVAGSLITLTPAACYFVLGTLIHPDNLGEVIEDLLEAPAVWFTIMVYVLFVHTVALLSLLVRWGALPLAIGLFTFGLFCFGFMMSNMRAEGDGMFALLAFLMWLPVVGVQFAIAERLRHLTARQ